MPSRARCLPRGSNASCHDAAGRRQQEAIDHEIDSIIKPLWRVVAALLLCALFPPFCPILAHPLAHSLALRG